MNKEEKFKETSENDAILDVVIRGICGTDDNGEPMAGVSVLCGTTKNGKDLEILASAETDVPVLDIKRYGDGVRVDMDYPSSLDPGLREMYNIFEMFAEKADELIENENEDAVLIVTIVPKAFDGRYYVAGLNPKFWCLQSTNTGGTANVIRAVFDAEAFLFYENENAETDAAEIMTDVEGEVKQREFMESKM